MKTARRLFNGVLRGLGRIDFFAAAAFLLMLRAARSVPRYLLTHPLFMVRAGTNKQLALRPTGALWLWVLLATVLVSFPLTANAQVLCWTKLGSWVGLAWFVILSGRLLRLRKHERHLGAEFSGSPYADERAAVMAWMPCSVACFLAPLAAVFTTNDVGSFELNELWSFLGWAGALLLFYMVVSRFWGLKVPALANWHDELPTPVQELADASISRRNIRRPSSTWRTIPDMSREVHIAGTYAALFSEDERERPIWSRSRLALLWYFAPIVIPLVALVAAPLLQNACSHLRDNTKVLLGLASIVWAAWSLSFFISFGKRDFVKPMRLAGKSELRLFATLLPFPNLGIRRGAEAFFVGAGGAVFTLLVVGTVPAYSGYLGLFTSPSASQTSEKELEKCVAPFAKLASRISSVFWSVTMTRPSDASSAQLGAAVQPGERRSPPTTPFSAVSEQVPSEAPPPGVKAQHAEEPPMGSPKAPESGLGGTTDEWRTERERERNPKSGVVEHPGEIVAVPLNPTEAKPRVPASPAIPVVPATPIRQQWSIHARGSIVTKNRPKALRQPPAHCQCPMNTESVQSAQHPQLKPKGH